MADRCRRCGACKECGAAPVVSPPVVYVYPTTVWPQPYVTYPQVTYGKNQISGYTTTASANWGTNG